jgi:hypothetical protein
MQALYRMDKKHVSDMPMTIELTATVKEWRELVVALELAEKDREDSGDHPDPIRPVTHCIKNLMAAIDDAVGAGYRSRSYSYDYEKISAEG